jgi:hypothetical protein
VEEKKEYINIKFKKGRERHGNQIFPPKLLYLSPHKANINPPFGVNVTPQETFLPPQNHTKHY